MLSQPGASKSINLKPSHHTRITRCNAHHRFRVTVSLGGMQPEKEDPSSPCREGGGIRWFSSKPTKLYASPYWWNGWRMTEWVVWSPSTQSSGRSSPSVYSWHRPCTITRMHISLPRVNFEGLQWCKPQWLWPHWWKWEPQGNLKLESKHHNRYQHATKWISERLNSTEKNHPRRTHAIVGICLRSHLGLKSLLCSTVVRPTEPFTMSLKINCHNRSTLHWPNAVRPIEVRGTVSATVMALHQSTQLSHMV